MPSISGSVGISNNDAILFKLPQKTREILRFTRIEVPPYNRDELNGLLKECAETGLRPGSYDPSLLEEIADIGIAAKGSGRFALEILWRVARNSEDRGLESISKDELERVRQEFELMDPRLSREELAIAGLLKNGPKTSSELYPLFWQTIPRSKRQIRNYLRAMEQKGVITHSERDGRASVEIFSYSVGGGMQMRDDFVSKGTVKAFFRQGELRVSKDLYAALDVEVRHLLDRAAKRATANGRTTMLPHDL